MYEAWLVIRHDLRFKSIKASPSSGCERHNIEIHCVRVQRKYTENCQNYCGRLFLVSNCRRTNDPCKGIRLSLTVGSRCWWGSATSSPARGIEFLIGDLQPKMSISRDEKNGLPFTFFSALEIDIWGCQSPIKNSIQSAKPFLVDKSPWREFDESFRRRKGTRSWKGFQTSLRSSWGGRPTRSQICFNPPLRSF